MRGPPARTDRNQAEVVRALRAIGCSVVSLAPLGRGVPDLLVVAPDDAPRGSRTLLLEVKDGTKIPSKRRLTEDEAAWIAAWRGEVHVVESVEDAIRVVRCGA